MFHCKCEENQGVPLWIINGATYTDESLPLNHYYDFAISSLIVFEVDMSLNHNTYQCYVNGIYSRVGSLTIIIQLSGKLIQVVKGLSMQLMAYKSMFLI